MKLLHGQSAPAVVAVEEQDSAERGQPGLSALPFLDLAPPPHALFVSLATKQCHAHTPPPKPQATPSSERSPTRSSVEQAGPIFPLLPGLGAKVSPPTPLIRNIPDTSAWPPSAFPRKISSCSSGNDLDCQGPPCSSHRFSGLLLPRPQALLAWIPPWRPIRK